MNVVDLIRETARRQTERAAVVEGTRRCTYRELMERVDALADAWRRAGMEPLHRVAFVYPDSTEYIVGSLAALACGAAVVPVSPALMWDEVTRVVEEMDVHHLVSVPDLAVAGRVTGLVERHRDSSYAMASRTTRGLPLPGYEALAPAFIRFSSGTTGTSKGVVLSHRSIVERTDAADRGLAISSGDVVLWVLSMSFHFVVTILLFLRRGATIALCQRPFPGALVEGVRRHRGTFIYASPFHYHSLASAGELSGEDLRRVRMAVSTAVKLPDAVAGLVHRRLGLSLTEAYGIIEVGLPFVQGRCDRDAPGGIGRPLPDYQMKLDGVDVDGVGEILLRGPGMLDAYFSPWRVRDQILEDGWFRTGDLGRLDEHGSLHIIGRTKQVINFGGMKIFPYEVEEVILRHGAVRECRVFGEPHPAHGQLPCAEVVLQPDASPEVVVRDIRAFCFRHLAAYKVPKQIHAVAALARTPSGKIRSR